MIPAIDSVGPFDGPADPLPRPAQPVPAQASAAAPAVAPAPDPGQNVRLTIDRDASGDFYVYTLTDRTTGRVIVQLPGDRLEALKRQPGYAAGTVVKTRA